MPNNYWWFPFLVMLLAFLTAYVIQLLFPIKSKPGRYETIDGMRGFLALFVFIHHCYIWRSYLATGEWSAPGSTLYQHFGVTAVSFFFMITAFLFITKLLKARDTGINWKQFYISRFFRLTPMYYVSVLGMILIILSLDHWHLNVSLIQFTKDVVYWGLFTLLGPTLINGNNLTFTTNAGVVWSLTYEWLFYLMLPIIAVLILKKKPNLLFAGGILLALIVYFIFCDGYELSLFFPFIGGAVAALLYHYYPNILSVNQIWKSAAAVIGLFLITQINLPHSILSKFVTMLTFILFVYGANLFGLLTSKPAKILGDMAYSIYLMHGILLFTVIYIIIGSDTVNNKQGITYCLTLAAIVPVLIIICYTTFRMVEKPGMDAAIKINKKKSGN